jgi:hypothetical protein
MEPGIALHGDVGYNNRNSYKVQKKGKQQKQNKHVMIERAKLGIYTHSKYS